MYNIIISSILLTNVNYFLFTLPALCGPLSDPIDGNVCTTGTLEGSEASYTCSPGFDCTGCNTIRTCQNDGQWDGLEAVCTG